MATSSFDTASSVTPVRGSHTIDGRALLTFLRRSVPQIALENSSLQISQFSHGQSNPTYLLHLGATSKLVLRKKPEGKILASAHAVEREYQIISALAARSAVPVPRPVLLCEDSSVLGTPFYLMEFAHGRIFLDPNLPECDPRTRGQLFTHMVSTLASLHSVPVGTLGLPHNFGRVDNYGRRQVTRWVRQYNASVQKPMPEMLKLISWLEAHIPAEDAMPSHPALCHGDYRLDNLVFEERAGGAGYRVKAVLDWELCTVGNPWADLAYNCMMYRLPAGISALARVNTPLPEGVPTETEYLGMYCSLRGLQPPSPEDWAFYLALSLFRLSSIVAGVQSRLRQGNASSAHAAMLSSDEVLRALAGAALNIIDTVSATSLGSFQPSSNQPAAAGPAPSLSTASACDELEIFGMDSKTRSLRSKLIQFMDQYVFPAEEELEAHAQGNNRWSIYPLVEELKMKAKALGLWNLWLPAAIASKLTHLSDLCSDDTIDREVLLGAGLSNLEYAHLCEIMGRSLWAPELFNCSAPDTGNMEVLAKYGSIEQQKQWLLPLLRGQIRSCFAMTEKAVPSSDATNIESSISRQSDGSYVLSGVKWWTSGACDPRCKIAIFMGKTDTSAATHLQQSMVLVPMDAPGIKIIRPLLVMGFDDAPHGHAEVHFNNVHVPACNMILGEGRGFEIAQGRLGPGRLHHCERLIGASERAIELMAKRALERRVFGRPLAQQGGFLAALAAARIDINSARLLVLAAAAALDRHGNKGARGALAIAKVAAPNAALRVIDAAIQAHGGAGVSQDTVLAHLYCAARTLRIADGPDEVHVGTIAKVELAKYKKQPASKL